MPVGEKVVIRLRMSQADAHYGGNLVDGARMLALFGDVATELLIRHDGDEGLFRAYDAVEFLAPVYAGDYIEAEGVIVEVGNTSRKMRFEARKVIRPMPGKCLIVAATLPRCIPSTNAPTIRPTTVGSLENCRSQWPIGALARPSETGTVSATGARFSPG